MTAQTGTAITIAFGPSTGFTPRILGVTFSGMSRAVLPDHDMASTHMDKSPGKVSDLRSIDVEFEAHQDEIDGASGPPLDADPETITFQWPTILAQTVGAALAGLAFVNNFTFGAPFEERQTGTFTVTWATKPTHTAGV